jgi:hypothetical protein
MSSFLSRLSRLAATLGPCRREGLGPTQFGGFPVPPSGIVAPTHHARFGGSEDLRYMRETAVGQWTLKRLSM